MNEIYKNTDWYKNAGLRVQDIIDNPMFKTPLKNENTYLTGSFGIGKTVSCYGLLRDRTIKIYEYLLTMYEPDIAQLYLNTQYDLVLINHSKIKEHLYDLSWLKEGTPERTKAYYTLSHKEYRIHNADLLIIDDFNKSTTGGRGEYFERTWNEFYYNLFEYRYINKLSTIFTSNSSLKEVLNLEGDNWIEGATKDRMLGLVSKDFTINNTKSLRHD
jgi:DNA replication protein DnaC